MLKLATASLLLLLSSSCNGFRLPVGSQELLQMAQDVEEVLTFNAWAAQHNKKYSDDEETARREKVFEANLQKINSENAKNGPVTLKLNEFADLTWEEFSATHLGVMPGQDFTHQQMPGTFSHRDVSASAAVDWRKEGAVTPVKNQAACGSCWAFSTTGSIEGINAIKSGELVSLSEQELVDCDTGRVDCGKAGCYNTKLLARSKDMGCGGGLMDYAFDFVIKNGGLDTEADYAYYGWALSCNALRENRTVVTIDGYEDVPPGDEGALVKAASQQPISVAICASSALQFYGSGIVSGKCCEDLNHGVLVAGYDTDEASGKPYFLVKNSWGSGWGEDGYFRLERGTDKKGLCGITKAASYPTKTHHNPRNVPTICGWWGRSECQTGKCNCNYNPLSFLPFDLEQYTCMDWGCENAQ